MELEAWEEPMGADQGAPQVKGRPEKEEAGAWGAQPSQSCQVATPGSEPLARCAPPICP